MPRLLPLSSTDLARHAVQLIETGQMKQAERQLKSVLASDPGHLEALVALGVLSGMRGDDDAAIRHLSRAAARAPASIAAQYNLGQALIRRGRPADAAAALGAVAHDPQAPAAALEKLGDCLRQLGRLEEAAETYRAAVVRAGRATGGMLLSSLVETLRRICDWRDLAEYERQLLEHATAGDPVEPLLLNYVSDDPALARRNATAYVERHLRRALPDASAGQPLRHARRQRPRLRLGYLGSDFRNHATAHLATGLFEAHDRNRFETFAISFGPDDASPIRRRLEKAFDRFVDLNGASSAQIVKRIHALGIDILVDLNGYIVNARPEILLARPAPVQCHFLAYPGTLASPGIDYLIGDPVVTPPGCETHFVEAIARLPDCYQPNDQARSAASTMPSRTDCGLPENAVVLASFNNLIKASPALFAAWMRILATVPDAVLWLFSDHSAAPPRLRAEASRVGIDPARLVFAAYVPQADHLARIGQADLALDSFPYGAHTTASDALWMGVPVVAIEGRSFAARVSSSLLHAASLSELVMPDLAAYEAEAISLARDGDRRDALRRRLLAGRSSCALFDTSRFTRAIEAAYETMWARWQRGEAPASFDVRP